MGSPEATASPASQWAPCASILRQVTAAVEALGLTPMIIAHRPKTSASAPRRRELRDGEPHEIHETLAVRPQDTR